MSSPEQEFPKRLGAKRRLIEWLYSRKNRRFCFYYNALSKVYWKSPIVLRSDEQRSKIIVEDGSLKVFIARPTRASRYRQGIVSKLDELAGEYMLRNVDFHDGDCVIDCGANVGEVGMWLQIHHDNLQIISIEPEEAEADCCDLNVYGGEAKTIRKALWREDAELTFYSKNGSGDSSLFEITQFDGVRTVQATTLSALLKDQRINKVKLLKLESEGAEPEILAGAEDCLDRIEYITADLGPERGVEQATTVEAATNFLLSRNFKVIDASPNRLTFLFKNQGFERMPPLA